MTSWYLAWSAGRCNPNALEMGRVGETEGVYGVGVRGACGVQRVVSRGVRGKCERCESVRFTLKKLVVWDLSAPIALCLSTVDEM